MPSLHLLVRLTGKDLLGEGPWEDIAGARINDIESVNRLLKIPHVLCGAQRELYCLPSDISSPFQSRAARRCKVVLGGFQRMSAAQTLIDERQRSMRRPQEQRIVVSTNNPVEVRELLRSEAVIMTRLHFVDLSAQASPSAFTSSHKIARCSSYDAT